LSFDGERVSTFAEKPQTGEGWINGGFFVLEPEIVNYIDSDDTSFESKPMERLTRENQLMAYRHNDFWQCMDTLRDVHLLENMWASGNVPWRVQA
jgi:glucose-1-phosphate cytidylyltransferase